MSVSLHLLLDRARSLLHARDGRLTRSLLREPGRFGLGQVPARVSPDATSSLVCGYCSTGCSLDVHLRGGLAVNLSPSASYPVNRGMACPKGWEALAVLDAPDRATIPLLRGSDGRRCPVDWPTAVGEMARRVKAIQRAHGPESVAFLGTGQITTEELALLGSVAKFGMGMVHGDGNTRQCMATAAVAYKQCFGFDAPPYSYRDLEESDCLVFVGSNPCIAHPILWERVMRNRRDPDLIVIDPRRTETAAQSNLHVPIRPKADLDLLYGLAHLFIQEGSIDRTFIDAHTAGFDAFAAFVERFTPPYVAGRTGLDIRKILDLADRIRRRDRVSFWWTMGVNQSHQGVRTAQAIIALALMTGNIGRPGTGANSITGQCNAMGSRLFSNTSSLLGGRDFSNRDHRAEVARILDIPEDRIPAHAGRTYDQILDGIRNGSIRGLWVVATNPAHSWIDRGGLADVLGRLDLLVVQDIYHSTETAGLADILLPAAAWGEKEGTFINSERRIGLLRKVRRAPGQALADFQIFRLVAEAYGCGPMFAGWRTPSDVFQLLKRLSAGRPCDITGIADERMVGEAGGIQWPCPTGLDDPGAERRLFADGCFYHDDGHARFVFGEPTAMPEEPDESYPLLLITGRGCASQWHTLTRTGKSSILRKLAPREPHAELHPDDATDRGIAPGDWVEIASRRGSTRARALLTQGVGRGRVFLPMHDAGTNLLTFPAFDPHSRQPAYKAAAVRIRPAAPPRPNGRLRRLFSTSR
ncbi:molybdopterin oxidoreductase family protein [Tautonia plasticadhaerens]|uniref:Nitrate reductase n=1 Tax=Tautonia plasticadhaerens TaxID=2527974 RepID=A0A518H4G5_9BACT|nr:nitrate reductase [Tautonia plasticadhaerens]QDV35732.1 Nitrate reductase [Tautonia plasticadhaerens]